MVVGHTATITEKNNKTYVSYLAHLAIDYQQGLNNYIVNIWVIY